MLGAVFGDIVGSAYEWNNVKTKDFPLERPGTRYTDDSVMTLAVAKWLLEDPSHSESHLIKYMQKLGRGHFKAGYGGKFREWLKSKDPQPYNSWGVCSQRRCDQSCKASFLMLVSFSVNNKIEKNAKFVVCKQ